MKKSSKEVLNEIRMHIIPRRKDAILDEQGHVNLCTLMVRIMEQLSGKPYDYRYTKNAIKRLVDWSYGVSRDGDDVLKGYLLRGQTGRGKTLLVRALIEMLRTVEPDKHLYTVNGKVYGFMMNMASAREIAFEYTTNVNTIEKYSSMAMLCIDDIGAEPMSNSNFGNKCSVVTEILCNRADRKLITFATTNVAKLADIYDDRVISRMNSLFNVITLDHDIDYRKL